MPNATHLQPAAQVDDERRRLVRALADVCRADPARYADLVRRSDALEADGMALLDALAAVLETAGPATDDPSGASGAGSRRRQ